MKSMALALTLVSTLFALPTVSLARSVDRTPVVASVEGRQAGITAAYLLADGRFQIKPENESVQTVVLSKAVLEHLTALAIDVADAKLNEQTSTVVCMMVPPESLGLLSVSGFNDDDREFNSVRKLVLTNSDCTVSHRVVPSNRRIAQSAYELRAALTALALNAVSK